MNKIIIFFVWMVIYIGNVYAEKDPCHQYYPNIPGKLLFENDKVVVQKFVFPPGVWEGIHSHPPDQFYVQLNAGVWTVRFGGKTYPPQYYPADSVGWLGPVALTAGHESVNSGDEPIESILVTLKDGC